MKKWKIVVPVVVIVLFVAWYAFRPERLLINQSVREKFPATQNSSSNVQALESGSFHSILHPTQGTATIYRVGDGSRVLRFTNFSTSNGPDVHSKDARVNGETEQRLYALSAWRETSFFTNRERAALAWTEALTLIAEGRAPGEVLCRSPEGVWRRRAGQPLIGDHHDQQLESTCDRCPQDPK